MNKPEAAVKEGKALRPIDIVGGQLTGMADKFSKALAGAMPSERFVQVAKNAIAANPAVLDADRHSLYVACMKAATDGLVLDGREAALTTFNTKQPDGSYKKVVQYMPMVRGLVKLMLASESVVQVSAQVVYENDDFEHQLGVDETIIHKRPKLGVDRGLPIGVYAIARLREGGHQIVVMDKAQVESVKACAKDQKVWSGPFWDQQWEKTALRRLSKRVEMGARLETAVAHDNELFDMDTTKPQVDMTFGEPGQPEEPKKTKAAEKILNPQKPKSAQPAPKPAPAPVQSKQDEAVDGEFTELNPPPPSDDDIPI
jgi:recombination protein RecT